MSNIPVFACQGGSIQTYDSAGYLDGSPIVLPHLVSIAHSIEATEHTLEDGTGGLIDAVMGGQKFTYVLTFRTVPTDALTALQGSTVSSTTGKVTVTRFAADKGSVVFIRGISGAAGNGAGLEKRIFRAVVTSPAPVSLTDNGYTETQITVRALPGPNGELDSDIFHDVALDPSDLLVTPTELAPPVGP